MHDDYPLTCCTIIISPEIYAIDLILILFPALPKFGGCINIYPMVHIRDTRVIICDDYHSMTSGRANVKKIDALIKRRKFIEANHDLHTRHYTSESFNLKITILYSRRPKFNCQQLRDVQGRDAVTSDCLGWQPATQWRG